MSKGPDLLEREEKKSYAAVFLLTVALLVACTVWAVWQDTFSRHLWKKYKTDFYRLAIGKYEGEIAAERERLSEIEEYVALQDELEKVTDELAGGLDFVSQGELGPCERAEQYERYRHVRTREGFSHDSPRSDSRFGRASVLVEGLPGLASSASNPPQPISSLALAVSLLE